ncbi:MAG TPA: rhodanese-like domain-containing protein [Bauldia sp.]|nr:rhodanese-like domain-containing protein [Bauldia sp.]
MIPKNIDARTAARMQQEGALLVDIRESGELARARIPNAHHHALSRLEVGDLPLGKDQPVIFFCAGGNRTAMNAARLAAKANGAPAYLMQGGISAWHQSGLPIETGPSARESAGIFTRLFGG